MTEAARRRMRYRVRLIRVQWLIILALTVALIAALVTRPAASVEVPEVTSPAAVTTAPTPSSSPEPESKPELIELGEFKTTAYCTCVTCCGIWSQDHPSRVGTGYVQKTASGTVPTAGRTISVDPDVIPLGTVVVIDGHEYVAEDTGSAVKGNIIDIYFASHEDACEYGVQNKTIYIKGE